MEGAPLTQTVDDVSFFDKATGKGCVVAAYNAPLTLLLVV